MLLMAGTFGRTVFVEKYDRQQISKLQTKFLHFCLGNPNFAWAGISSGLLAPDENFNYLKKYIWIPGKTLSL